jgi:hypothetical protein
MHYHLTNAQFIIGCFALVIALFLTLAAVHDLRVKRQPPFRNYFYSHSGEDDDLLQQSNLSDPEEWRYGQQSLVENFDFHIANSTDRLIAVRESARQNIDRD